MRYARERKVHAQKKRRKERGTERERGALLGGGGGMTIKMFGVSFRRTRGPETSTLPLFFQKTMSDSRSCGVGSFRLSISGKEALRAEFGRGSMEKYSR